MRLLEELFNRVKTAVAQEEMEKREKELSVEREKRIMEEATIEQAKKLKIEQEVLVYLRVKSGECWIKTGLGWKEAELNEKIRQNLEKQQQMAREAAFREEIGEFELRKKTSDDSPGGSSGAGGQMPVPRSIILGQNLSPFAANANNTTPRPQLYEDDDNTSNSNPPSKPSVLDTNSNLEASQHSIKSNEDSQLDADSQH